MDRTVKIMPCLDMQNGRVVKGVHFVDIKDAGDPVACARAYCESGADELALLDIDGGRTATGADAVEWAKRVDGYGGLRRSGQDGAFLSGGGSGGRNTLGRRARRIATS